MRWWAFSTLRHVRKPPRHLGKTNPDLGKTSPGLGKTSPGLGKTTRHFVFTPPYKTYSYASSTVSLPHLAARMLYFYPFICDLRRFPSVIDKLISASRNAFSYAIFQGQDHLPIKTGLHLSKSQSTWCRTVSLHHVLWLYQTKFGLRSSTTSPFHPAALPYATTCVRPQSRDSDVRLRAPRHASTCRPAQGLRHEAPAYAFRHRRCRQPPW